MRICVISYNVSPLIGGIETYSNFLIKYMSNQFDTTVLKPTFVFKNKIILIIELIIKSWIHLSFNSHHVVHVTNLNLWPIALINLIKFNKVNFIFNIHGLEIVYRKKLNLKSLIYRMYVNRKLLNSLNISFISNSMETQKLLKKELSIESTYIPMGVEKNELNMNFDNYKENQIFFLGRIVKRKGLDWFIKNILGEFKDMKLYVAGPIIDKKLKNFLSKHKNVIYLGILTDGEIKKLHQQSLFTIFPNIKTSNNNDFEGFGMTFIQAVSNGGIVLGSFYQGVISSSLNGKIGYLAEPNNSQEWIIKINEIIELSSINRKNKILNDQDLISKNFYWEIVFDKTVKEYKKLITNS